MKLDEFIKRCENFDDDPLKGLDRTDIGGLLIGAIEELKERCFNKLDTDIMWFGVGEER